MVRERLGKLPALSVIIPTKNEERFLPTLLGCLKRQTFQDFEIIVGDNHSTDRTRAIAHGAGARVVDGGLPAVGRNNGVRVARAEQLLFLDADVTIEPDFLERSLAELKTRGLKAATVRALPNSRKLIDRMFLYWWTSYLRLTASFSPHAAGFCIFSTKKAHAVVHGFDETMTLAEDSDYVRRMGKSFPFGVLSTSVTISVRRMEKEGRIAYGWKLLTCEIYRIFVGEPAGGKFEYDFSGYDSVPSRHPKQNSNVDKKKRTK